MILDVPEHIEMLRESLRRFIEAEAPRSLAAKWDKENHFPREVFRRLADLGVMGLTVPEEYGGTGRDILATMVVIEELARRSMALAVPYVMAACYAGMNIVECGSESQKRSLLPRVSSGDMIFAYGWTEPDVGADIARVKTSGRRDAEAITVNGAKRFCSGAELCDYIYALVKSDPEAPRDSSLSLLLIPPQSPGVSITRIDSMGLKGCPTTDVSFLDVRVPLENIVGGPDGWNRGWNMITGIGLDVEKLEVAALALGIASAAFDDAREYSLQRVQFGKTIASYQDIRHKLAGMHAQLHASRLVLYEAALRVDRGAPCALQTSTAKLFVTESAKQVVLECQTIFGAYGYVKGFDMERYVRDVLLMPIIGGSTAIQKNNIAKFLGVRA